MKRYAKIVMVTGLFLLWMGIDNPIMALSHQEETIAVPVSYIPDVHYTLVVEVRGGGRILDGSQAILDGQVQYEFLVPSEKQFTIVPDMGYQIEKIEYQVVGRPVVNVIDPMINDVVTIAIEDRYATLYVEFHKVPTQPTPSEGGTPAVENPTNMANPTNTGDSSAIGQRGIVMVSMILVAVMVRRSNKKHIKGSNGPFLYDSENCIKIKQENRGGNNNEKNE